MTDQATLEAPALRPAGAGPRWADTVALIRSDFRFRCVYEHKQPSWWTAIRMLRHPGVGCVLRYRLQCFFYANHLAPLGGLMKFLNLILYGVEISEHAQIGGGLFVGHAVTILVGANVVIGERCVLFHQNTIGPSPFFAPGQDPGPIVIGNDVTFGGGACAYGKIVIGDRCLIGVNSVVDQSCPPGSSLFGVPARVIGRRSEPGR